MSIRDLIFAANGNNAYQTFTGNILSGTSSSAYVFTDWSANYLWLSVNDGSAWHVRSITYNLTSNSLAINASFNAGPTVSYIGGIKALSADKCVHIAGTSAQILQASSGTLTKVAAHTGPYYMAEFIDYVPSGNYIISVGDSTSPGTWNPSDTQFTVDANLTSITQQGATSLISADSWPTSGAKFDTTNTYYFAMERTAGRRYLMSYPRTITSSTDAGASYNLAAANCRTDVVVACWGGNIYTVSRSGTSLSYSAATSIGMKSSSGANDHMCWLAKISDNNLALAYIDPSNNVTLRRVTVSGTTITLGAAETLGTSSGANIHISYSTANKVLALATIEGVRVLRRSWML